jgi:uncharacterized membrane protein/mono/diheme cytochrome c family protein
VFLTSLALLLLPAVVKLDGKPHPDWLQFLGRFHPLAVHIPIGLIVLLPILEIAGRLRPSLKEAAGFVLPLACAACLGTLILGYLLAYGSGDTGATLTRHMWGGIALTIGMLLCVLARSPSLRGPAQLVYPALLTIVLLALVYTAHQGGSLTHGENYLTAYMPSPLKRLLPTNGAASSAIPNSFYAKQIHPIFDSNCVSCHGAGKSEGGLRLDSYEQLMRGAKDGPVIVTHNAAKSLLFQRVTLPANDRHFMPAEGRPPLRPQQIQWIRVWIEQGASPTSTSLEGIAVAESAPDPPAQPVGDYSALMPEILAMRQSQGAKLFSVSAKPSDGLILNTVDAPASFGDAQLAAFQKFAPFVVEANLSRTAITDASLDTLSKFSHLRALHLEGTAITGQNIARLTSLSELRYLNLSDTRVDSAAIAPLASMKNLHHIYLFNTPAQPVSSAIDPQPAKPVSGSSQ